MKADLLSYLAEVRRITNNLLDAFPSDKGSYKPAESMLSAAEQIYHIAKCEAWIRDGVAGKGWDPAIFKEPISQDLKIARAYLDQVRNETVHYIEQAAIEDLSQLLTDEPFLAGLIGFRYLAKKEKFQMLYAMVEHEAHHRGQLIVYLRFLGKIPPNTYE